MRESIFKWNDKIPVELMRVEVLGKLYGYARHNNEEMVFRVVPNGGYQGSVKMLKAYRIKREPKRATRKKSRGSQAAAAKDLGVSQSAIARYETNKLTMPLRVVLKIERRNAGVRYAKSWLRNNRERVFKLKPGTLIFRVRIDARGKRFAYDYHKGKELFFRAVPKVERHTDGSLLKEVRKELHWTQAEVAKRLGIPRSLVAMYETGTRFIPRPIEVRFRRAKIALDVRRMEKAASLQKGKVGSSRK